MNLAGTVGSPWRLSVAPMMDWTDRHCRYFHRLLSPRIRLYTEMVSIGALEFGDIPRHLDFDTEERPLALQLGGSDPTSLARGAQLAQRWGYDEVNLNCGCPSPRVQRGAFGACLMEDSQRVAECAAAMRQACDIPVTIKHRLGLGQQVSYDFMRDFVGTVSQCGGVSVFIVHARNAWLEGLSPKDNRDVPPLRYDLVYRLKQDFPSLTIVLNGGINSVEDIMSHWQHVDGVMVGRRAYHHPWDMTNWDCAYQVMTQQILDTSSNPKRREAVEQAMVDYMMLQHSRQGVTWPQIARHMLGLWNGTPGARRWRQVWSDHRLREVAPLEVWRRAQAARLG